LRGLIGEEPEQRETANYDSGDNQVTNPTIAAPRFRGGAAHLSLLAFARH
jgi:hypothetical protein